MRPFECPREQDVLDALASRRWPHRCDEELRAHVANCVGCADLATVAAALLEADDTTEAARQVPPASLVWWRAQLRAREESARAALRPIRTAQIAALAVFTTVLIIGLAGMLPALVASVPEQAARVLAALPEFDLRAATDFAFASLANRGVQLAAGAWLVLTPVAAYLAFSRD
jgi:hypothetical protein